MNVTKRIIVGITGASGIIYGIRLLEVLSETEGVETHLVISKAGEKIISHETNNEVDNVKKLADFCYDIDDIGAPIASGSFSRDGMIVAPCSMKTLSALANSYAENLLTRAGDVTLKERKPLVLLVREMPIHLGHIRNMLQVAEMGAIVAPASPSFYHNPKSIDELVDYTVGRLLDLLGIKNPLSKPWTGIHKSYMQVESGKG